MGIHFGIAQIVAYAALYFLVTKPDRGISAYYSQAVMLTGLTGLIALAFSCIFYRGDWRRRQQGGLLWVTSRTGRRLSVRESVLLLAMGAGLAEYMNLLVSFLTLGSDAAQEYSDSMTLLTDGKSFWYLVLWMGIAAPIAEEAIFRWLIYLRLRDLAGSFLSAVLSGAMFGIYHWNLIQGIYAGVLGFVFALVLEWSGSLWASALLHIGANIFSLAIDEWSDFLSAGLGLRIFGYVSLILFFLILWGLVYFYRKYAAVGKKRLL